MKLSEYIKNRGASGRPADASGSRENLYADAVNSPGSRLKQRMEAMKEPESQSVQQTPYADAAAQSSDYSGYLDIGNPQNRADRVQAAWMKNDPELAQSVGYITGPGRRNQFSVGGGQTGTLNQTVYDSIDSGMSRNETWDVLADDYRDGLITKEEFIDAIHYADYLEAMKSFGKKPSDEGFAQWRNQRLK